MDSLGFFVAEGLVFGFALNARPGPALTITIRGATRGKGCAGPVFSLGRVCADLVPLAGLGALTVHRPEALSLAGPAGVGFGVLASLVVVIMGWRLMEDRGGGALHRDCGGELVRSFSGNPVCDGFLTSITTPGWHLFWWTAGLWMISDAAAAGAPGVISFAGGIAAAGLGWHVFVAWRLASPARDWALSDRQVRVLTSLIGMMVVAVGLRVAVKVLAGSGIRRALGRAVDVVFT